jgi:hypothetical protein
MEHTFRGGCSVGLVTEGNSFVALAVKAIMQGCHETAKLANAAYAAHQSGVGGTSYNVAQATETGRALGPNAAYGPDTPQRG